MKWAVLGLLLASSACSSATVIPAELPPPPMAEGQAPPAIDFRAQPYEPIASAGGVVVFELSSPSLIRLGAEGRLPAPPDQVHRVLLDFPRHAAVLDRVSESRVLERGDRWLQLYQRLSLPVVSDRDWTLRVTWGTDGERRWIRYRAESVGLPVVDGVVRVTRNFGGWDLVPTDHGRATVARYQSNMDMAGSLPLWMTQSGAADEVPALYHSMCGLLPEPFVHRCGN